MADEKGTGRHPHKNESEPWHHTKGSSEERNESRGEGRSESRNTSQGGSGSDTRELKEREYRDKEGNIHHHTHTSEAMKDKERKAA